MMTTLVSFCIAGGAPGSVANDLWLWNSTTAYWTEVIQYGPLPPPRCGHQTVIEDGIMYLFGGFAFTVVYNDCWALNISTFTWKQLVCTNPPSARYGFGMQLIAPQTVLIFGGSGVDNDNIFYNDTWVWNLGAGSWQQIQTSKAPSARFQFSFEQFESGQVVLYGGWITGHPFPYSDVWAYDIKNQTWRELKLSNDSYVPAGRTLQGTTMIGCSKMVVSGGRIGDQSQSLASADIFTGTFKDYNTFRWLDLDTSGFTPQFGQLSWVPNQIDQNCFSPVPTNSTFYNEYPTYHMLGKGDYGWLIVQDIVQGGVLGCDPGYYTLSFDKPCIACPMGQYAPEAGSTACTYCHAHTTTNSTASTSSADCDHCGDDSYCAHSGICTVHPESLHPTCTCSIWFTSEQCASASTLMIVIISTGIGLIFSVGLFFGITMVRKQRQLKREQEQQAAVAEEKETRLQKQIVHQKKLFEAAFKIDPKHLEYKEDKVFEGAFGIVRKGYYLKFYPVAIKNLKDNLLVDQKEAVAEFKKEVRTLQTHRNMNSNIVYCFGSCLDDNGVPTALVLEWCEQGDLYNLLKTHRNEGTQLNLPYETRLVIARDVAKGLQFVHSEDVKIVHRDLKSQNILITSDGTAKIGDFGMQSFLRSEETTTGSATPSTHPLSEGRWYGTPEWNSPEAHFGPIRTKELESYQQLFGQPDTTTPLVEKLFDYLDFKSDVFNLGVILWELQTFEHPHAKFIGKKQNFWERRLREAVLAGLLPNTRDDPKSPDPFQSHPLTSVYIKCWAMRPADRPSAAQVLADIEQLLISSRDSPESTMNAIILNRLGIDDAPSLQPDSNPTQEGTPRTPRKLPQAPAEKRGTKAREARRSVSYQPSGRDVPLRPVDSYPARSNLTTPPDDDEDERRPLLTAAPALPVGAPIPYTHAMDGQHRIRSNPLPQRTHVADELQSLLAVATPAEPALDIQAEDQ